MTDDLTDRERRQVVHLIENELQSIHDEEHGDYADDLRGIREKLET